MWLWLDKIVMSDLLALIREITGPAMVAFCDFYSYEFSRQKTRMECLIHLKRRQRIMVTKRITLDELRQLAARA